MRLIDLLVIQSDNLRFISQFVQQLNLVDVGSLYGGVNVPHVHFFQRIYLVVLSQHFEYLTVEVCVGMIKIRNLEVKIEKGTQDTFKFFLFPV